jgi:hypothetical protein
MKKLSNKFFMVLAAVLAGPLAMAQGGTTYDFKNIASKAQNGLTETLEPVINIVSILVALIGVVMLIWNFVKRSKSDGQSNDALVSWGVSLIFVFVALQVIKFIFI